MTTRQPVRECGLLLLLATAGALGCDDASPDEAAAVAPAPVPSAAEPSTPADPAEPEPDAVPTQPVPVHVSTLYNVPDAPVELLAVEHDPVDNVLTTRIRNTSEDTVWGLSFAVRFLDASGEEVLAESRANYGGGVYSYGGSGGPYICGPGRECTIEWRSSACPVPESFADVQMLLQSVQSASADAAPPARPMNVDVRESWRLSSNPDGDVFEHPSVTTRANGADA